ncbi:Crp/Fnr family transcriptional regulator [Sphingomonas sp. G-3-2-10]|jgi:CRP-like cAMP-binding protein|uniref:Crp/Fnr family transcriptional regulator n=1 Tax=Sphingomonas sp. G-3-2-10 TaxID=2728838 RepID=UPI00146AC082|nr:Crp/Fnr family transcriptional regulator [Sphingomonas sp. G-3-2-10]NML07989.1 Crp/Fnr family transcriptional regulator [Sphingomonas sp. G-3-2-10]
MIERHLTRMGLRHEISAEEERAIRSLFTEVREYPANKTAVRAEQQIEFSTLLLDGLMCRYKDLKNGQRQIAELHVAGDFADLHSYVLKRLDHNIMTLTACRIAIAPHHRLREVTEAYPRIAKMYWFSTALDASIHREWVLSLGRRTALSRMAALFCELQVRLAIVDLADEGGFDFALNQVELAECLGLTPVHVNRTLKQLRELHLMTFRNQRVDIHDFPGLKRVAEFDPFYLYLDRQPF